MVSTFRSANILDLVCVNDPSDTTSSVSRTASARCFLSKPDDDKGTISQIIGSDYNIFCTKSRFFLDGETVKLEPGFSYVNAIEAVWDPSTITMKFYFRDILVGSATVVSEAQPLSVPLQGLISLFVTVEGVDEPLPYQTIVYVYGYPLATDYATWFDWVSRGDVIFPMTFVYNNDRLEINNDTFIATYSVLAEPLTTIIHPRNGARVIPFVANQQFPLYTVAQYQYASNVTL